MGIQFSFNERTIEFEYGEHFLGHFQYKNQQRWINNQ